MIDSKLAEFVDVRPRRSVTYALGFAFALSAASLAVGVAVAVILNVGLSW